MPRISEIHYRNDTVGAQGPEFIEVALSSTEFAANLQNNLTVSFYDFNVGVTPNHGVDIALTDPGVQVFYDGGTDEYVFVLQDGSFSGTPAASPLLFAAPDDPNPNNYEAVALTNTSSSTVIEFYEISGGSSGITAIGGAANGATTTTIAASGAGNSVQFNTDALGTPPTIDTTNGVTLGDTGPCFAAGSLVDTPDGPRAVEDLQAGDLVNTADGDTRRILWVGGASVRARDDAAPVKISAGTLGATRDVYVSPQHRLLVGNWQSEMLFGHDTVFIPALAAVNGTTVTREPRPWVSYHHILLERHAVLTTSGVKSESLFAGIGEHTCPAALQEAAEMIPELRAVMERDELAHPSLTVREAQALEIA